jgi:HrpA-like RNA helicase
MELRTEHSRYKSTVANFPLHEVRPQVAILSCSSSISLAGKETLVRELKENDVIILVGETGSGKTTRGYLVF